MTMTVRYLISFLIAFLFGTIISPLIVFLCKKLKANQTILFYVKEHESKNGTPTMGGIIFITVLLCVGLCLSFTDFLLSILTMTTTLFYGILGFLDDFLKVHYKQNLGLRAYQKIIGQVGISIIFAFFVYFSQTGGNIFLLFGSKTFDIKWVVIPFVVLVMVATTNSVNLTDGLDGLAGSVSFVYLFMFIAICSILGNKLYLNGEISRCFF